MNPSKKYIKKYWPLAIIIILAFCVCFYNLAGVSMFNYDEARHAVNALEILKTNDWIVTKYGGVPDRWNLKPPLGAWLIAISFKIFGINVFALRFFSALAGFSTIVLVYFFGTKIKNRFVGFFASLFLIANINFIKYHGTRTGDYDVLVTFFITLSLFMFYLYEINKQKKYLYLTALSIALAVMIKGAVGLISLFVILVYLAIFKKFKEYFNKETLKSIFLFLIVVLPWIILRLIRGSKFFVKMIKQDIFTRGTKVVEGHVGDIYYYYNVLFDALDIFLLSMFLIIFVYFLYLGIVKKKKIELLLTLWVLVPFTIFTLSVSKLYWYMMPVYPAISLILAKGLEMFEEKIKLNRIILTIIMLLIILPLAYQVYTVTNYERANMHKASIDYFTPELQLYDTVYVHTSISQTVFFQIDARVKYLREYSTLDQINDSSNYCIFSMMRKEPRNIYTNYEILDRQGNYKIFVPKK